MRISVLRTDPGFHNFIAKSNDYITRVFLDDVMTPGVMTADEETGFALVAKTDKNMNVIKPIETYDFQGRVKIVFSPREFA